MGVTTRAICVVSILTLAGCATLSNIGKNEAEKIKIKRVLADYEVAVNNGDIPALMSLYSQQAVQAAPDEPLLNGLQAISDRAEINHGIYAYDLSSKIDDLRVQNSLATLRTTYSETLLNRDNKADSFTTEGMWLLLLEQNEEGQWKIFSEIWNNDQPAVSLVQ